MFLLSVALRMIKYTGDDSQRTKGIEILGKLGEKNTEKHSSHFYKC